MTKNENFRAYHFGNFYLSSIQQGIQTAHCQTNMFLKYIGGTQPDQLEDLLKWVKEPVTICLNGGANEQLEDMLNFLGSGFESKDNNFAWDFFQEDQQSLNKMITNVGVIVPSYIWDPKQYIIDKFYMGDSKMEINVDDALLYDCGYSSFNVELINRINSCGLAR